MIFINKKPLYAPMLSSFGGGSIRGFNPGSGDDADWRDLTTGDTYQSGTIRVVGTTMQWIIFPESRVDTGVGTVPSSLTGDFEIRGQTQIAMTVVGGGGGGLGGNGHGGGGGGGAYTGYFSVSTGDVVTYEAGDGGLLGLYDGATSNLIWHSEATKSRGVGGQSRARYKQGGNTIVLDIVGNGGTGGNYVSNGDTSNTGQGGSGNTPVNTIGATVTTGNGGRGGGRSFSATAANTMGGGGGGAQYGSNAGLDAGGNAAGNWGGGGGGGGSPHGGNTRSNGGNGSGVGQTGGQGGDFDSGSVNFGTDGSGWTSGNIGDGGGYSLVSSDGNTIGAGGSITRGSAGGGGFPGGGGGGAYWYTTARDAGYGGDGASGVVVIQWQTT